MFKNSVASNLTVLLLTFLIVAPTLAYTVKTGDTVASIVRSQYKAGPVFGKSGGVAKLLSLNPHIEDPNNLVPGTIIKLNKELLKPGITDDVEETAEDVLENEVKYNPSVMVDPKTEINPYIEVEKYDASNGKIFKNKPDDKISFFIDFQYNSLTGKNLSTIDTYNFNTSSETDVGFEYAKYATEKTNYFGRLSLNQFAISEITTLTPVLDKASKAQASASLGGLYLFTEGNFVRYAVNYQPHYYLDQTSLGHLILEYRGSPSVSLDTENHIYNNDDFILGLNFGFEYITNSLISGNGLAFDLGFVYQQDFKSNDKLRVKFIYEQSNLDSSTHNLIDNSLSLSFSYSLPY